MDENKILLLEYDKVYNKTCAMERIAIDLINVIIAILAGAIGIILAVQDIPQELFQKMLLFIPPFVNSIIIFAIFYMVKACRLGGYLGSIEHRINEIVGKQVVFWEINFAEEEQSKGVSIPIMIIFSSLFVTMCIIPFYLFVFQRIRDFWALFSIIVICVEIIDALILIKDIITVHRRTMDKCFYDYRNKEISKGDNKTGE